MRLSINDKVAGEGEIPRTVSTMYWPHGEGLTCGYDNLTTVTDEYTAPFTFTGTIRQVLVDIEPEPGS